MSAHLFAQVALLLLSPGLLYVLLSCEILLIFSQALRHAHSLAVAVCTRTTQICCVSSNCKVYEGPCLQRIHHSCPLPSHPCPLLLRLHPAAQDIAIACQQNVSIKECICRCNGTRAWDDGDLSDDKRQLQAVWGALCEGGPTPLATPKHRPASHDRNEEKVDAKLLQLMETARVEKHVKSRLAVAAAHFNRDYKKGFQFLQVSWYFR